MLALVGVALAVYAVESIALPVIPGRDLGTYVRFYAQMWTVPALPMTMLFRTPLGSTRDRRDARSRRRLGGTGSAGRSVRRLDRCLGLGGARFGRRRARNSSRTVLYPGYGILFHALERRRFAAAFAGWGLALSRAVVRPTPLRFALVGAAIAATALSVPGTRF